MNTPVKDVMTSRVIWMEEDTPFTVIARAFEDARVSAFPVLNHAGKVVGVVSEADLLAKLALADGEDDMPGMIGGILRHQQVKKAGAITAGELMTAPPVTISPEETAEHAARLMYLRRVTHLPVIDAEDRLVGIIGRADVLSVYSRLDTDIREEVQADVALAASPGMRISVAVRDGIVTLDGRAQASQAIREITRRVRHIEGVVAVRNRVSCPPPGPLGFVVLPRLPVD